ncbi:MAG: type II restriction endonuclease [Muribaculaceae bacterium]|nr:type II restriction endonuclease [Muribaculaceae bacterium]
MKQLKETHLSLKDYVDFQKVAANVETSYKHPRIYIQSEK